MEAQWVLVVASDLTVNLDVTITGSADLEDLLLGKSVLQALSEEDRDWNALTELVWALGWAGSVDTAELVKAPGGWGEHSLQVLLWTSCLNSQIMVLAIALSREPAC